MGYYSSRGYGSLGDATTDGKTYTVKAYKLHSTISHIGKVLKEGVHLASKIPGSDITVGVYNTLAEATTKKNQLNTRLAEYVGPKGSGEYVGWKARIEMTQKAMTPDQWKASGLTQTQYNRAPGTVVTDHATGKTGVIAPDGHTIVDPGTGEKVGDSGGGFLSNLGMLPILIGGGLVLFFILRRKKA